MRELFTTPQFRKDLRDVPSLIQDEIDLLLLRFREDPTSRILGAKKLRGIRPSAWRIRIGAYRLVYTFTRTTVILLRIRHRKDIYRNL